MAQMDNIMNKRMVREDKGKPVKEPKMPSTNREHKQQFRLGTKALMEI